MDGQKSQPFKRTWMLRVLEKEGYLLAQPKLNGVHLVYEDGRLVLPSGEEATGLPEHRAEMAALLGEVPAEAEAYCHGVAPQAVAAVARRPADNLSEWRSQITLHVFDLCTDEPQLQRLKKLIKCHRDIPAHRSKLVKPVQTFGCDREARVARHLGEFLSQDLEGIVLRDPSGLWKPGYSAALRKIKPGGRDEYTIIGCNDHTDDPGTLYSITVEGQGGQMTLRHLPYNDTQRWELWQKRLELIGRKAIVRYSEPPKPGTVSFDAPPMVSALVSIEGFGEMEAAA